MLGKEMKFVDQDTNCQNWPTELYFTVWIHTLSICPGTRGSRSSIDPVAGKIENIGEKIISWSKFLTSKTLNSRFSHSSRGPTFIGLCSYIRIYYSLVWIDWRFWPPRPLDESARCVHSWLLELLATPSWNLFRF